MAKRTWVQLYVSLALVFIPSTWNSAEGTGCSHKPARECSCHPTMITDTTQFCAEPKYRVNSMRAPQFTAQPQSSVYHMGDSVHLDCNITSVPGYAGKFLWEFNGTLVSNDSLHTVIQRGAMASRLLLPRFSEQVQGEYRCRVKDGNNTLLSQTAMVELPAFRGWIDRAYPPQPSRDKIELQVTNGSSAILECHPNTTEPVIPRPSWLRNNTYLDLTSTKNHYLLPDGSLLVRDLSFPPGSGEWQYKCIISLPTERTRDFVLSWNQEASPSIVPINQTVTQNSSTILYCITSKLPSPNVWLKDDTPVRDLAAGGVSVVDVGEVLVIERVSMEMGGKYTCVTADGQRLDARVTVVAPPTNVTLSISGSRAYIYDSTAYVPMPLRGQPSSLNITCNTNISSDDPTVRYNWVFRGVPVDSNSPNFYTNGNTLLITTADIWDVVGTFQCFVVNMAGSMTTNIQLLIDGKLNPPTNIYIPPAHPPYVFEYDLQWDPPDTLTIGDTSLTSYTVEVLVVGYDNFCSCAISDKENRNLPFLANDFEGDWLYFRVAANTDKGQSDFVPYGCPSVNVAFKSVPTPALENIGNTISIPDHQWKVALVWGTAGCGHDAEMCDCQFPSYLIDYTTVQVNCDGMETITQKFPGKRTNPWTVDVPCCTACNWSVTYDHNHLSSRNSSHFKTRPLAPAEPAALVSVDRTGSDGKSITARFTLPINNVSCICSGPPVIFVKYTNSTFSDTVRKQLGGYNRANREYSVTVELTRALCWAQYNVSVAYGNTNGNSSWSSALILRGPLDADMQGFENLAVETTTSTSITVTWQLLPGMACLIAAGFMTGKVCYSKDEECRPQLTRSSHCQDVAKEGSEEFRDLDIYTKYCIVAFVQHVRDNGSIAIINSTNVTAMTKQDRPSGKPQNLFCFPKNNQLHTVWDSPPKATWNGVLTQYQVNVTSDNNPPQSRTVPAGDSEVATSFAYNAALQYGVYVSACTAVGCGPPASTSCGNNTKSTVPTDQARGTGGGGGNEVTIIAVVVGLVVVVALVVITIVAVILKPCNQCRKRSEGYLPFENEPYRDEPFVDDVVSVGRPAPSVHSEHTEYNLLQRHLKDRNQLEQYLPDGSADGYRPKEEEGRPDGTGSTECLLDPARGQAAELNQQVESETNKRNVTVELEPVTSSSGEKVEQDSTCAREGLDVEKTPPLVLSSRVSVTLHGELEPCKPKPQTSGKHKHHRKDGRKAGRSEKSKKETVRSRSLQTSTIPPVVVNPTAMLSVKPPIGYATSEQFPDGATANHINPTQSNHLVPTLMVIPELAGEDSRKAGTSGKLMRETVYSTNAPIPPVVVNPTAPSSVKPPIGYATSEQFPDGATANHINPTQSNHLVPTLMVIPELAGEDGKKAGTSETLMRETVNSKNAPIPPVVVNPTVTLSVKPPIGYVTSEQFPTATANHNGPTQTNHLAPTLMVIPELPGDLPQLSSTSTNKSQQLELPLEPPCDLLQLQDLCTESESNLPLPPLNNPPCQQLDQFKISTSGYVQDPAITNVGNTQGYLEDPSMAASLVSEPRAVKLETMFESLPQRQAESIQSSPFSILNIANPHTQLQSLPSTVQQTQNGGYHVLQGSVVDAFDARNNQDFDLGELAEEYDDSASDTSSHSSVFEDSDVQKSYTPWPQAQSTQQRTRSQVTSGIASQSESSEPDTASSERWRRMKSEGYCSDPDTPLDKEFPLTNSSSTSGGSTDEGTGMVMSGTTSGSEALSSTDVHSSSSGYVTSPIVENPSEISFNVTAQSPAQLVCEDFIAPVSPFPASQQVFQNHSDNRKSPQGTAANETLSFPLPTLTPPPDIAPSPSMVTLLGKPHHSPSSVAPSPKAMKAPLTHKQPQSSNQVGNTDPTRFQRVPSQGSTKYTLPSLLGASSSKPFPAVPSSSNCDISTIRMSVENSQVSDSGQTDRAESCEMLPGNYQNYVNTTDIDMDKIVLDLQFLSQFS